jgi:hypothetical protein
MNGRTYAVTFNAVAVTAASDLFELTPADDKPFEIVGIELGQYTDAGDAADKLLGLQIIRGFTSSGSGGSSATPTPISPNAGAAGFTAEVNNTTLANTGTTTTLLSTAFNVRAGYINYFPADARPVAGQGNTTIVVRMTAPADSITLNGTIYVRELA